MPSIMVEGPKLELEKKRQFVKNLTDAAEKAYGIPRQAYIVLIKENPPDNVGVGGELLIDRRQGK